ncbi:DUF1439 domain-containing protein [Photobacterium rosenbergii]|uniref:DUF1439 domain-containing protein n=1 Tax=Photobacterium rosenbergii TaxID=294936 RepID=A0A2T3N6Z1_9GAMM|nr:DUF1439 domain-containing protein [Photobacterium rosenbergii]MBY5945240.1 DUF1439 domain-containing protein [Photobacterium rosenbergii]PSW08583.1 DUF1439 domain-containing protein [Photobacterium rosenbergii]
MIKTKAKLLSVALAAALLGGCASYSISEQDMTNYLQDSVSLDQSVGVENVMYAEVAVDDLEVKIGRADADRVSVFASTNAQVQMLSMKNVGLDLDVEFSAVPEYDKDTGEVYLKSLRLERFDESSQQLTPEVKKLLKPAVSMIGYALSKQPVYKLDSSKVQEALIKSAEPNLVIKNNKLVIELFD